MTIVTTGPQRIVPLTSAGLAIKAGGSAVVKTGSDVYYYTNKLIKLAAADMPALVGTVTNAMFNVFVFFVRGTTTYVKMGTEGSSLGAIVFPSIVDNDIAVLGYVIVNPTGTGNFVGGTTPLDDATVAPNAVYVNCVGGLYPL